MVMIFAIVAGLFALSWVFVGTNKETRHSSGVVRWMLGVALGAIGFALAQLAFVASGPKAFVLRGLLLGVFCLWTCRFGRGGVVGWFIRMCMKFIKPPSRVKVLGCGEEHQQITVNEESPK